MISFDTNIVFTALAAHVSGHEKAREWLVEYQDNHRVVLCELMLLEVYSLLRNPTLCPRPLDSTAAAAVISSLRQHPVWRLVDYAPEVAKDLWVLVAQSAFPYKRIYDARLALTLRHHGVTEFATRNTKDFQHFGFKRVWDPLAAAS